TRSGLTMSGLVVSTADAGTTPSASKGDSLKGHLAGAPTTARAFSAADAIVVFANVFESEQPKEHTVTVTTTVTDDNCKDVFKAAEDRGGEALAGKPDVQTTIPLKGLAPGSYVIPLEARSAAGGAPASRQVAITIK